MELYDFSVKNIDGEDVSLAGYQGKVLLIVNTATHCGFTPQYTGLQQLYARYQEKGFEILDFPCNQFGGQAPEDDAEIQDFCTLHYHTTFPRFAKINVNGKNASPLYAYLKEQQTGTLGARIKWNFTKFLVDKNGRVVRRYGPDQKPEVIEKDLVELLGL
ncbi:glutathione peroxidase [Treponema sp. TIM-1]|uniref:glutathione peroxidase n=1 Tax=Treponema sp. TIM-1 TaxID=2898417 RepID=UPI00397FDE80